MPARLTFSSDASSWKVAETLLFLGRRERLLHDDVLSRLPSDITADVWRRMLDDGDAGDEGRTVQTFTPTRRIWAGLLPEACSRHNTPSRAWAIPRLVSSTLRKDRSVVFCALDDDAHAYATGLAVARALPTYTPSTRPGHYDIDVQLLGKEAPISDFARIRAGAQAVRVAAHLVDAPPNVVDVNAIVKAAEDIARRTPEVGLSILRGHELETQGLGGLFAVGRAAAIPPAMVVLDYSPEGATHSEVWVGKGIVFDTGGLSLKARDSMSGMKTDLGGAAAVLAAFEAAVKLGAKVRLTAVLCCAENAVGPGAYRPDDILSLYSGKTVEVNNTDAEGRLVLADGLAWAVRHRDPDRMFDLATLTGAQSITTGKRHAGIYTTDEALEGRAVVAGRACGDLVHPLLYAPELMRREFSSPVADMKNSVKDRNNAQSSCAAQFLQSHLGTYSKPWMHVDMAGPVTLAGRASGYGPALLLTLAGVGAPL